MSCLFEPLSSRSQICANLDSAIVSTKNYAPELKEKVPKPIKTFDIVDKRLEVNRIVAFILTNCGILGNL